MRRWLGIVLVALAACGQPPATVAVRIEHRARVLPDGGRDLTDPTTTSSTAHLAQPKASRSMAVPRRSPAVAVQPPTGDIWWALGNCESHNNPQAVGGGGRYFGAFQFALTTWHSLGYAGNPVDYPYATQLEAAQRLVARSGWGQFPVCSRRIGMA